MIAQGAQAESIRAALGPAIGSCCFEVEAALAERFADAVPGSDQHARPGDPAKPISTCARLSAINWKPSGRSVVISRALVPARNARTISFFRGGLTAAS